MEKTSFQTKISNLDTQVSQYKKGIPSDYSISDIVSSPKLYIIIPITILFLIILSRPSFIMSSDTPTAPKKISVQKIFIYWVAISTVLVLGLFAYNYNI